MARCEPTKKPTHESDKHISIGSKKELVTKTSSLHALLTNRRSSFLYVSPGGPVMMGDTAARPQEVLFGQNV